ncbi:hypothetical protein [Robertmurraya sp. FSL R5-0851]|uniref:hypothetical protein n=1 Tax=Robertmurraya sp. FSL R5-0851 TaxID=2921584 RepID=UPI0030F57519
MQDKILDLFKILFEKMWGWIYAPFKGDLDSLNTLIYKNEDKYYGIFSEEQFGVVAQGMAIMQSLSVGIILVSIIIAAMRISSSGINPSNRTSAIEYFKDFIIVALLFFNLSTIFELIFAVNSMFVNGFSSAKAMIDGNTLDKVNTFFDKGVLGGLIIGCILLGLWIWANFFYMMRTLTLMLLMIISPVAVALYLVPQTKGITLGVFKEFTGTVLVQSIHAFTYWVITAVAKDDFGLGSVILYIIFIPITESIRSLIGLGGQMNNNLSRAASMMGGAAIMGMYASVKGALNGESFSQAVRRGLGQGIDKATGKGEVSKEESDNPKGILAGAGTDVGSTERAERMLKSGEVTSKMGKAVFGMAGALAGSPMGPMGSAALGQVGFAGGGVVGGLAGRSGMAGIEGLANRGKAGLNAFKDKFKGVKNAEDLADEKLANTLADNEANAWASDNKESFMKGLKERFPDADDHSLNKMWDKEVSGKKAEFLKEARSTVGEMKSTSGKVAKASDLIDSTVNNLTNDWAKNNKDAFMRDYDVANPLPVNASEVDIRNHNNNKNSAWDHAVQEKKNTISDIATNAVGKLGLGASNARAKDFSSAVTSLTNDWAKDNKEAFMKDYDSSNPLPPNATEADRKTHNMNRDSAWNKAVQVKKDSIGKSLSSNIGSGNVASAVTSLTNDWAKDNKEAFMKDYDSSNPLPPNATEADRKTHNMNRDSAWNKAVQVKKDSIGKSLSSNIGSGNVASAVTSLTNDWAKDNKGAFMKDYDSSNPLPPNATEADRKTHNMNRDSAWNKAVQVKKDSIGKSLSSNIGSGNVTSTVTSLTNDWAKNNKENFMKDYDSSNPLPPNSTEKDLQTHNDKRNSAWDKAVQEKKISITKTVSSIASNNLGSASESILVNKEEFVNEIGSQVGSVIGKGAREGILAVKGATSGVQNASLYSGKAVNTDFVASHLATMKTNGDKESYIESAKSSGMTESQAIQQWNTKGAADTFAKQYSSLMTKAPSDGGLPRHIPLDHKIIGGNNVVKGLSGVVAGAVAGAGELTGITPTAKFISDTKLAAGAMGSVLGAKEAWTNRSHSENIMTSGVKTVGAWGKSLASHYQAHVPENVVEKQANFRNANAYLNGVVGGVRGYKMGASSRTPYDQLVNDQVKEVSEIQQMVQMVGPKGQEQIAAGAIRMVTTRGQSVIQVKDKTGNIQTVSRIASGDSSLPKGETIFQDLAIQDGQLTTASNVYKEDSGGGKVTLNRSINVNPNRIIANRNTPQNPRVVQEIQSYNQLVDSGQYTQKQAIAEMTDIRMVVDRNRSYLIGKKDGSEYRISPYGRGDARLTVNEVVERPCETVQSTGRLVVKPNDTYTSSTQPDDIYNINELLPRSKPNKRNMTRQLNEKFRNKSFTESLKG